MGDVDTGIDDRDLDARASVRGTARAPCRDRVDEPEVRVIDGRVVQARILDACRLGRCAQLVEARTVELDRDGVEAQVPIARHLRHGGVGLEPLLEIVAQGRQLGAI